MSNENEINYTPDLYTLVDEKGEEQTFEFALEGDHLTIVPEDGAVELYQCTMENATMYLTRINNDGTLQTLREVYAQSDVQPDPVPDAAV